MPEGIPLKNFANFSRTIGRYDIKLHTLVTHLIVIAAFNLQFLSHY